MSGIDFVIPVKCNNFLIRTVIECVNKFYHPKNIYIITSSNYIHEIQSNCRQWTDCDNLVFIDEDTFFVKKYNLTKCDIEKMYCSGDTTKSREFGWWYQQLLKLGSVYQIDYISNPYVVWDSDLVSLNKWDIFDKNTNQYKFAILQENAKNDWNKEQYAASIHDLIGLDAIEPELGGTFVPHHFIFHHDVIRTMLRYSTFDTGLETWIERIVGLSHKYYRFSEYKCVATFMKRFYPHLLCYHKFEKYGKGGIRYRESSEIVERIKEQCVVTRFGLSYQDFCSFVDANYVNRPSYIQIEHVE